MKFIEYDHYYAIHIIINYFQLDEKYLFFYISTGHQLISKEIFFRLNFYNNYIIGIV